MKQWFVLFAIFLSTNAWAVVDNIIGDSFSGNLQLIDNSGNRWNLGTAYTTNGNGDIYTLGGVSAAGDTFIGDLLSGNHQLIDNSSRRWNLQVFYTTDGHGNVIPITGGGGGGGVTPNACTTNQFASALADSAGTLTCSTIPDAGLAVSYLKADGSRGLSANWNAGAHTITATTFIGALTGNSSTSTALAANPTDCSANNYATAIDASGNLTCGTVSDSGLATSYVKADGSRPLTGSWNVGAFNLTASTFIGALTGNASTATALAANPTDCGANNYATTIDAGGNLTCATVSDSGLTSAATVTPFTANSILKRDASGWIEDDDPSFQMVFKEDFLGYQSANNVGQLFNGDSAGTSANGVPAGGAVCPDSGHIGCAAMTTGSTTTGRTAIYTGAVLVAGGGTYVLEWDMNLSALSNGTDTFTLLMGFCDIFSSNNTDCTTNSGGYIQYTHSVNSGNLVLNTKNGGSKTTTSSTTAMAAGNHKFQIQINAAGTLTTFLMDGVSMGTVAATIPTLVTNPFNVAFDIVKSAGTTAAKMNIDYIWLRWKPTIPR